MLATGHGLLILSDCFQGVEAGERCYPEEVAGRKTLVEVEEQINLMVEVEERRNLMVEEAVEGELHSVNRMEVEEFAEHSIH